MGTDPPNDGTPVVDPTLEPTVVASPVVETELVTEQVTTTAATADADVAAAEVPVVVSEDERVRVLPDGTVQRELDRVETVPARRRNPLDALGWILLVVLLIAAAVAGTAWYLTRDKNRTVPTVTGLALSDAVSRLQQDGFKTTIVTQVSGAKPGIVVSETPAGGTRHAKGSTVQVVSSKGPSEITVPNGVGLSEADARDRLVQAGFQVKTFHVFSGQSNGTVVAQDPAAGAKVAGASIVRLNVSKGAGTTTVPDVTGQSRSAAEAALANANLKSVSVIVPSSQPAGTVVAQNPSSGQIRAGTTIRLNISDGSRAQTQTTPTATTPTTTTTATTTP